jgi:CCR4-NOT transcriptional regulation complex NOT5 subunit
MLALALLLIVSLSCCPASARKIEDGRVSSSSASTTTTTTTTTAATSQRRKDGFHYYDSQLGIPSKSSSERRKTLDRGRAAAEALPQLETLSLSSSQIVSQKVFSLSSYY